MGRTGWTKDYVPLSAATTVSVPITSWSSEVPLATQAEHGCLRLLGQVVLFVMPNVRIPEQEERRPPRQCNSQKGKFIADSSQGSCRIQRSGVGSESPEPKLLHKFIG